MNPVRLVGLGDVVDGPRDGGHRVLALSCEPPSAVARVGAPVGIRSEGGDRRGRSERSRDSARRDARLRTGLLPRTLDGLDGSPLRRRRPVDGFAEAAERAGISRIIYLGGLGEAGQGLSEHLSSRREVERMLASPSVPVTVIRAGMIIGAGSASFDEHPALQG